MRWVIDRSILKLCRLAERRRGTTPRLHGGINQWIWTRLVRGRPQVQPLKEKEGMGDAPPSHWTETLMFAGRHYAVPRRQGCFRADSSRPTSV